MAVKIVTDSTSDLPASVVERLGITVVAQNIHFGVETFKDGVTLSPDDFYSRLAASPTLPKTSQASPGDFGEVYGRLCEDADAIVSLHVSSKVSGTYNSAVQAAGQDSVTCPVEVIDSEQVSIGLGLMVIAAAEAANRGASRDEVVEIVRGAISRSQCFCLFETLEYLEKGGRIGKARAMFGSMLKIKPMIIIRDGEVHELGKGRTFPKALSKFKQIARGYAPVEALAVIHSTTPDLAGEVANDLRDMLPSGAEPYVARFGPALGVYTGPGAVGIGLIQARS